MIQLRVPQQIFLGRGIEGQDSRFLSKMRERNWIESMLRMLDAENNHQGDNRIEGFCKIEEPY